MTTLQKTIVTVALATLAGAGIYEARQAAQLRQQNQILKQEQGPVAAQFQNMQTNGEDAANTLAGLREENAQLRSNQTELLKLRGEVGSLRKQADDANQRAQAAQQKLSDAMSSVSVFKAREAATINAAKQMCLALRVFESNNNEQFPTNVMQLSKELGNRFSIDGVDLGAFEYTVPGAGWSDHLNTVVLRERIARQAIDGSWERIYAFVDGSVQKALSNDGNFEAWEKINTYSPPTNQNP
jgi:hypothetical protein